jgi:NAD(P)H-dependent FMN reductase
MWKWFVILSVALLSANLRAEIKILAFSGSTREDSFNKKLVSEAADIARHLGAQVTLINLKDYPMPFYDADLEAKDKMPLKAKELRQLMIQSQVIFIASPEYNGSLSGVLKNAIDWASRNENGDSSREAFKGKKFVIMSASPGAGGGARGLKHLRIIIENIGGTVVPEQIEIPNAFNAFDEKGHLKNPKQKMEFQQLIEAVLNSEKASNAQ